MSDTKPTEVILLAEKIGLPVDASAESITARVYEMQEKLERAEKLLAEQDNLLARAEDGEKAKAKLKQVEAKLFIERAIANQWIDKAQESFYVEMYAEHPERVKKHIEDQKYRSFMSRAQALKSGDKEPVNAVAAIEAMAVEMIANDPKLSKSDAYTRVMNENPDLAEKYRSEVVLGAKGGDR